MKALQTILIVLCLITLLNAESLEEQGVNFVKVSSENNTHIISKKISNISYSLYTDVEFKNKIFDFSFNNVLDEKNQIMDCDMLTCDMKLKITAGQNIALDNSIISGGWQMGAAKIEKIFFYQNITHSYLSPIYKRSENGSTLEIISNETLVKTETIEQTDLKQLHIQKGEYATVIVRFSRPSAKSVDIYPIILGTPYKEWAWWNISYNFKICNNISSSVGWGMTDYVHMMDINSTWFNFADSNGTDFRWTWWNATAGAEQITTYWREKGNWSATSGGRVYVTIPLVPNGATSTWICLYFNATGASDASNGRATFSGENNNYTDGDYVADWSSCSQGQTAANGSSGGDNSVIKFSQTGTNGLCYWNFGNITKNTSIVEKRRFSMGGADAIGHEVYDSVTRIFQYVAQNATYNGEVYQGSSANVMETPYEQNAWRIHTIAFDFTSKKFSGVLETANHTLINSMSVAALENARPYMTNIDSYLKTSTDVMNSSYIFVKQQEAVNPTNSFSAKQSNSVAPNISNINITPYNPKISQNLSCNVGYNGTDATANITINWSLNGVIIPTLATSCNATNNTFAVCSVLAYQNISENQNWSCSAIVSDSGGSSGLYNSTNVTTQFVYHPDVIEHRLNASVITTSSTFTNFSVFNFTSPFNASQPTSYFIYATLTSRAITGNPTANYRIVIDGTVIETVARTVGTNGVGSVALASGNFTLVNGTHTIGFEHARTGSGTLASENITALVFGMRDIDNNRTINYSSSNFVNSTTSASLQKINSFTLNTSTNSSIVILSEYNLNNTGASSGTSTYRTSVILPNGTTQNCSTVSRFVSSGTKGSVGSFCAIFPDNQNGSIIIETWASTETGMSVEFNGTINAFEYLGESQFNLNKTDLNGKTITTANAQLANTSVKIVVVPTAKHNIDVLVSISGNASATSILGVQVVLYNESDWSEVARSLTAFRRFGTAGQAGVLIKVASFVNISAGNYTALLLANTTAGTITVLDGRIVAMASDATASTEYILPPNPVIFYKPENITYNSDYNVSVDFAPASSPNGLVITAYDILLLNASTNTSVNTLGANVSVYNSSFNLSGFYGQHKIRVIAYQSDGQMSQSDSSIFALESIPTILAPITFANSSAGHWFIANATFNNTDGWSNLASITTTTTSGICTYVSNITNSINFTISYNCSGTAFTITNVTFNVTLAFGSNNSTSGINTFPNQAPTAPTNLVPNGGEFFVNTTIQNITINWTNSTDADKDVIVYYLWFSNDSGATYYLLGNNTTSGFIWNISAYPKLSTYRIKVYANDSYNVSSDTSSASDFTISYEVLNASVYIYPNANYKEWTGCEITLTVLVSSTWNATITMQRGDLTNISSISITDQTSNTTIQRQNILSAANTSIGSFYRCIVDAKTNYSNGTFYSNFYEIVSVSSSSGSSSSYSPVQATAQNITLTESQEVTVTQIKTIQLFGSTINMDELNAVTDSGYKKGYLYAALLAAALLIAFNIKNTFIWILRIVLIVMIIIITVLTTNPSVLL